MSEKNIEEKIDLSLLRDFEENGIQAIKDFLKNVLSQAEGENFSCFC